MQIYLDIDGVMVPGNSWRKPEILEDGFPRFSRTATNSLVRIISKSSAEIVLITSHKNLYSLKEWKIIFKKRNIEVKKISKLPKNTDNLNRKDELMKWFDSNQISESFIIIDDDKSLNSLPVFFKNKLIQPSASVGLTEYLADEALKIISKSNIELA